MIKKILHRVILFASLLGFFLVASKVISHYQTGANHKSVFLTPIALDNQAVNKTVWINNALAEDHPNIKYALTKDLNYAWTWLNKSLLYQTSSYLENYFHDDMINKIKSQQSEQIIPVNREIISHKLELLHLSLDKSVAVIKDHKCVFVQREIHDDSEVNFFTDSISYTAIFVFSDGIWKINNWISEVMTDTIYEQQKLTKENIILKEKLKAINSIRGINYYSQDHPWHYFWDSLDVDIIKSDFALVKDLNLNTLRLFIPFQTFNQADKEKFYLAKLDDVLDIAEGKNLQVQLTLFDFPVGFTLDRYAAYESHLEQIVRHVKKHPALLAWNIKNEPDLDFEEHGQQAVLDWLAYFIDRLKVLDPEHPITTSWSKMEYLGILAEKLDFLSYHMYLEDSNWQNTLQYYKLAFHKPIVLEEFGVSTRQGLTNLLGKSESHQSDYIRNVITTAENNYTPWMLWTLYDFNQIPKAVFRSRPWIISKQSHFGLIRKDGSQKEIYHRLKDMLSK